MRQVLSISLPNDTIQLIKKRVKKRKFRSLSSYIKHLLELDDDDDWISEQELLRAAKHARQEYKQGKLKKLNSLRDLM